MTTRTTMFFSSPDVVSPCVPDVFGTVCTLRPGCKINLFLRIVGVYPDGRNKGRHELDTVFLPLDEPHDELLLREGKKGTGLSVRCDSPEVDPEQNTLTRAYALYAAETGFRPDLEARLIKGIPSGAGLGGGSSDAAALLLWLEAHSPVPLGSARLAATAAAVGADVPFFLINRPCRARGIGEVLSPCDISGLTGMGLVLICPPLHVSTSEAYAAWDRQHAEPDSCTSALTSADPGARESASWNLREKEAVRRLENSFEDVVFKLHPQLAALKNALFCSGAQAAVMSGSGSALFGLFGTLGAAVQAARVFRASGMTVYVHEVPDFLSERL